MKANFDLKQGAKEPSTWLDDHIDSKLESSQISLFKLGLIAAWMACDPFKLCLIKEIKWSTLTGHLSDN